MSLHITALVYCAAEPTDAELAPLRLARQLATQTGAQTHAILIGPDASRLAGHAAALGILDCHGINISTTSHRLQEHQLTALLTKAVKSRIPEEQHQASVYLLAADTPSEAVAGPLGAALNALPLGKVKHFEGSSAAGLKITRTGFGGRLDLTYAHETGPVIVTVRSGDRHPAPVAHTCSTVSDIPTALPSSYPCEITPSQEPHAQLEGARLVVSGGRGIGAEEGFGLLYELAEKLGGAVGSSLPAVDAGWAPVARQVGQSGKFVSPAIYLAIGISGTPQHMAGIAAHTRVVAINNDPDAPVFKVAEVGAIADWKALVPALIEALDD